MGGWVREGWGATVSRTYGTTFDVQQSLSPYALVPTLRSSPFALVFPVSPFFRTFVIAVGHVVVVDGVREVQVVVQRFVLLEIGLLHATPRRQR